MTKTWKRNIVCGVAAFIAVGVASSMTGAPGSVAAAYGGGTDGHASKPAAKPASGHGDTGAPTKLNLSSGGKKSAADAHGDHTGAHDHANDASHGAASHSADHGSGYTAEQALEELQQGNARWVSGKPTAPNTDDARLSEVAAGQHPFVTVLTCADSRIPVERVFDRGVGDVFVVRVAGNITGTSEIGTIEYGTGHLGTPLLVVMGHTSCGAVAAAVSGAEVHGSVRAIIDDINPAVERARAANPGADEAELAALAIRENVWQSIFDLYAGSETVRALVNDGALKVVGAVYDIETGEVQWMGPHPWESQLLAAMNRNAGPAGEDGHGHDEAHGASAHTAEVGEHADDSGH